ncbi:MAG: HEAT repeat domain-containing protein, partial [Candidatus Wallbacteria bacterium]|nr:HEAT repeat domain-containing protein [Candidatus Wallbacteria bacterium]
NRKIIKKLRYKGEEVSQYLFERTLREPDRFLAIQLLNCISTCQDQKLRKKMLAEAKKTSDEFIFATYISLFKRAGMPEALSTVRKALQSSPDNRVRANAAEYMAEFGELKDIKLLEDMLDHPSNRVKINCLMAVARICERTRNGAVDQLKMLSAGEDPAASESARFALREMKVRLQKKPIGINLMEFLTQNY